MRIKRTYIDEILEALAEQGFELEGPSLLTEDRAHWSFSDTTYPLKIYDDLERAKDEGGPYRIRFMPAQKLTEGTPHPIEAHLASTSDSHALAPSFEMLGWSEIGEIKTSQYVAAQRTFREVAEPLERSYIDANDADYRAEFARDHSKWAQTDVMGAYSDDQETFPCPASLCDNGRVLISYDGADEQCSTCHGAGQLTREQVRNRRMEAWKQKEPTWGSYSASLREAAAAHAVGTIYVRMQNGELVLSGWECVEDRVALGCVVPETELLFAKVESEEAQT